jgi:hypothetical protein
MFIAADSKTYAVYHVDVYQGKNPCNIDIHPSISSLPTTQKAVVNACIGMGLHQKTTDGARHISMDNRYQCPELAFTLREKFRVNSTGTCRVNRKGWDRDYFDLKKNLPRGTFKRAYDFTNKVQCVQWVDSKVVNFVSSLSTNWVVGEVKRQVGSVKKTVRCPNVIRRYQQNMFGVDKGDQLRARMGGFANKAHFKKWYKKCHLGLMDIMLLNAYVAYNMAARERNSRAASLGHMAELLHFECLTYIAECMLNYRDPADSPPTPEIVRTRKEERDAMNSEHRPVAAMEVPGKSKKRCTVCRLECYIDKAKVKEKGLRKNIVQCSCCHIIAHNFVVKNDPVRKIHSFQPFKGLTCFDIIHSKEGFELWKRTYNPSKPTSLQKSHELYEDLREMHGKQRKYTRKRKRDE